MNKSYVVPTVLVCIGLWGCQTTNYDSEPQARFWDTMVPFPRDPLATEKAAKLFSPQAIHDGVTGWASVKCKVAESGQQYDCVLIAEQPGGVGIGDAALSYSLRHRLPPYTMTVYHGHKLKWDWRPQFVQADAGWKLNPLLFYYSADLHDDAGPPLHGEESGPNYCSSCRAQPVDPGQGAASR